MFRDHSSKNLQYLIYKDYTFFKSLNKELWTLLRFLKKGEKTKKTKQIWKAKMLYFSQDPEWVTQKVL